MWNFIVPSLEGFFYATQAASERESPRDSTWAQDNFGRRLGWPFY